MNPASKDIKELLIADSSFGDDIFIGKEPTTPHNCITIFDTPGEPPDQMFKQGEYYNRPSIQFRVRNTSYMDAWDSINAIKVFLHNHKQVTINGTLYSCIKCAQEPALLDWDKNDRCRFVTTFKIQRT